jgi:hypothetical protein
LYERRSASGDSGQVVGNPYLIGLGKSSSSLAYWFRNDCTTCFGGDNAINATQRNATTIKGSSSERNCFN